MSRGMRRCAMCGRPLAHREATVGDYDLCHPADGSTPDCYHLHTVYGKPLTWLNAETKP